MEEFKLKIYDGIENPMREIVHSCDRISDSAATSGSLQFIRNIQQPLVFWPECWELLPTAMCFFIQLSGHTNCNNAAEQSHISWCSDCCKDGICCSFMGCTGTYILIVAAIVAGHSHQVPMCEALGSDQG